MNHWKVEVLDSSPTELGGFKEIIFLINGTGAYSKLKYENGAHRVQRVPETESGGRTHTSTATVACLPEAEEVEIVIHEKDIRTDTFASSGPGRSVGQHDDVRSPIDASANRHHCVDSDEKSQIKKKKKQ